MKKFFKEFKEFIVKGNMMDIAIGIIIGASFNTVVSTLVKKILMPPLSLLTNNVNFSDRKIVLSDEVTKKGEIISPEIAIGYGEMLTVMLDFLIIAFSIYLIIKFLNRLKLRAENTKDYEITTPKNIQLLSNIEKLLERQNELLSKENQSS